MTAEDEARRDREELVAACRAAIERARAVMRNETDHIMQHTLTNLVGELQWCAREYGGDE